jgi:hypothetical protein
VSRLIASLILLSAVSWAAVTHVPIKSGLALNPGEAYAITVDGAEPAEIGWTNVSPTPCSTNCVEATQLAEGIRYSFATGLGGSKKYIPSAGRISIEYKNVSAQPVTIDIYRVQRTCDAEACQFFDPNQEGSWLVFKIDQFNSISTSADGSYSTISGVAVGGKPFTFKAVWWSDNKNGLRFSCANFIQRWITNHAPADQYRPYIFSGHAVGTPDNIVLKSIDACVPKAPHYGVPEANVFK